MGVIVRRYIDFFILHIPTPLVSSCSFLQQHPYFLFIFYVFRSNIYLLYIIGHRLHIPSYACYNCYNYEHHLNFTCIGILHLINAT